VNKVMSLFNLAFSWACRFPDAQVLIDLALCNSTFLGSLNVWSPDLPCHGKLASPYSVKLNAPLNVGYSVKLNAPLNVVMNKMLQLWDMRLR
jgi:hypothetical protein